MMEQQPAVLEPIASTSTSAAATTSVAAAAGSKRQRPADEDEDTDELATTSETEQAKKPRVSIPPTSAALEVVVESSDEEEEDEAVAEVEVPALTAQPVSLEVVMDEEEPEVVAEDDEAAVVEDDDEEEAGDSQAETEVGEDEVDDEVADVEDDDNNDDDDDESDEGEASQGPTSTSTSAAEVVPEDSSSQPEVGTAETGEAPGAAAEDRIVPGVGSAQETRSPARPARTALNAPSEGVSADAATLSGNLATQEGVASLTSVDISQLSSTGVQQSTAPGRTIPVLESGGASSSRGRAGATAGSRPRITRQPIVWGASEPAAASAAPQRGTRGISPRGRGSVARRSRPGRGSPGARTAPRGGM